MIKSSNKGCENQVEMTLSKILKSSYLIIIGFLVLGNITHSEALDYSDYDDNLKVAGELYLLKKDIPLDVLLGLVPKDDSEFELYYGTTYPDHRLSETGFFYETTQQIFEQVTSERNDDFYLPSLKLISFADGEFAEEFIEYLEKIIEMDKEKFCESIDGQGYAEYNPIKYYSDLNRCD